MIRLALCAAVLFAGACRKPVEHRPAPATFCMDVGFDMSAYTTVTCPHRKHEMRVERATSYEAWLLCKCISDKTPTPTETFEEL